MKPTKLVQREVDLNRRRLLAGAGAGAAAGLAGWSPVSLGQGKPLPPYADFKESDSVIVHSANTIETERSAFGTTGITLQDILYVRNNLSPPDPSIARNPDEWTIEIDGVAKPRALTVGELKRMGLSTVAMVLQCSGNGRAFSEHKASGTQWTVGAAGNTIWSGVPVKAVVEALGGVRPGIRYMTSAGGEVIPPGIDPKTVMIERSVPWTEMERAILAWEVNGERLTLAHGGPLRMIIPGYYGINNVKYVKRLAFTEEESEAKIQQTGYRVRPPGVKGAPTQPSMWEMNLKSFITGPAGNRPISAGDVQVHGVAFSGGSPVNAVEVSVDGGESWQAARFFGPSMGRYAWRQFVLPVRLRAGSYEITSRAIADDGEVQPEVGYQNERGYALNGWRAHAINVSVK